MSVKLSAQATGKPAFYITTAIPYVNAPPHIGFALEIIQADVLARYYRAKGYDVRFQTGSDENSLKNVQAAERAGVSVEALVARNAGSFVDLQGHLDLSFDDFIRTSSDPRHRIGVEKLWRACADSGDIYKRHYRGLYCLGCEQFYRPSDLRDGLCPEHKTPPQEIAEENYFFRLSRYEARLHDLIKTGALAIEPASRRNEVLRWIENGLEDFSISRSSTRARGWGIPVPGDASQVMYVWFDALGNYITALDYGTDGELFRRFWCSAAQRVHVIGKGITRFHALYWPAMLLSAGVALPSRILVHGYVTVEGEKIGKSAGNAVDPVPLAAELGADALRYYLLRYIRSTEDGDFSYDRFLQAYHSDLADQLGNLARRSFSMIDRYFGGIVPEPDVNPGAPSRLAAVTEQLSRTVDAHIEAFALHEALNAIWACIGEGNKYVTDEAPWSLARQVAAEPGSAEARIAEARLRTCLLDLVGALHAIGHCCRPFIPASSEKLLVQLGRPASAAPVGEPRELAGTRINDGEVLFPKVR